MTVRPSLVRNIPFWVLLVGSVGTGAIGAWLAIDKLTIMSAGLADQSATLADVYVGQVWAIIGGILIATGVLGILLSLVVAVLRSFVPVTDVEIIEALDWSDDDEPVVETSPVSDDAPATAAEPVVAADPVVATGPTVQTQQR